MVEHVFKSNPTTVTFELNKGYTYNFYAISNMRQIEMPTDESQAGCKVNLWIANIDDLECVQPVILSFSGRNDILADTDEVNADMEFQ